MKKFILSLIWVVLAAMPTLNAQQASPGQTTARQQTSKPKSAPNRVFPQPKVQPTQPTTANNTPGQKKGVANNPGYGKPTGNDPGNGKTTDNGSQDSVPGTGEGGAIRSVSTGTLTVSNSSLTGNATAGSYAFGGAIYASGALTVEQVVCPLVAVGGHVVTRGVAAAAVRVGGAGQTIFAAADALQIRLRSQAVVDRIGADAFRVRHPRAHQRRSHRLCGRATFGFSGQRRADRPGRRAPGKRAGCVTEGDFTAGALN